MQIVYRMDTTDTFFLGNDSSLYICLSSFPVVGGRKEGRKRGKKEGCER